MFYNFNETLEINENVYHEPMFVPRYVNVYMNKKHYYDDDVNKRMGLKEYNIGDKFEPFDNSFCIDLETGKREWIAGTSCGNPFKDHNFIIVDGPYWDHVTFGISDDEPASVFRFVTVKDSVTGKYYRVHCREFEF
jgi:hypothetical protein